MIIDREVELAPLVSSNTSHLTRCIKRRRPDLYPVAQHLSLQGQRVVARVVWAAVPPVVEKLVSTLLTSSSF